MCFRTSGFNERHEVSQHVFGGEVVCLEGDLRLGGKRSRVRI